MTAKKLASTMTVKANGSTLTLNAETNGYKASVNGTTAVITLTDDIPGVDGKQVMRSFNFTVTADYITSITDITYSGSKKAGTDIRYDSSAKTLNYSQIKVSYKTRIGIEKNKQAMSVVTVGKKSYAVVNNIRLTLSKKDDSSFGLKSGKTMTYKLETTGAVYNGSKNVKVTDMTTSRTFSVTCAN
jgi:hypothetical protein